MSANADDTVVVDVQARLTNLDQGLIESERRINRFTANAEAQSSRIDRAFSAPGGGPGGPPWDPSKYKSQIRGVQEGFSRSGSTLDSQLFDAMKTKAAGLRAEFERLQASGVGVGMLGVEFEALAATEQQAATALAAYEARLVAVNREEAKGAAIRRGGGTPGVPGGSGGTRNVLASSASAAGLQSIGLRYGAIGLAATAAFQAVGAVADGLEVSGDAAATFEGKARNATASLIKLDAAGVVMALDKQKEATSWQQAKQELDNYTRGTGEASFGITRAIDKIELLVGYDRKLDRLTDSFNKLWAAAHPPTTIDFGQIAGGTFGITPLDPLVGKGDPTVGLTQQLKTALAAAGAVGDKGDQLAQLHRAGAALKKQLAQPGLTDADRQTIYDEMSSISSQIATLTKVKKPAKGPAAPIVPLPLEIGLAQAELTKGIGDDLKRLNAIDDWLVKKIASETDQNRKLQEIQRLSDTRQQIASLTAASEKASVTDLFQGPVLTSKPYQFAEQFGFKPGADTLLKDIRGQVAREKQFIADLARLRKLGASQDLIGNLAGQGAAGAGDEAHALAGAGRETVRQYTAAFGTREKQQQQLANLVANVKTATITVQHATFQGGRVARDDKFAAAGLSGAR